MPAYWRWQETNNDGDSPVRRGRRLMPRAYRDYPASISRPELGHGFGGSVQPNGRDIRAGNALEDRYWSKRLIIDVHVGIRSRSSSVEACLAPIREKVRSQAVNQLIGCGGRRCHNFILRDHLWIRSHVRAQSSRGARQQCGQHEWREPTRCSHINPPITNSQPSISVAFTAPCQ